MSFPAYNSQAESLSAAVRIGMRLTRDAVWDANRCNWLGASFEEIDGRYFNVVKSLGPELYSGTSGVALFLAHLFRHSLERSFRLTSLGAIRQALSRADDVLGDLSIGVYSGYIGIGFASMLCGSLLGEESLILDGLTLIRKHALDDIRRGRGLDVVSGIAGVIPVLIAIGERTREEDLMRMAVVLGERLMETAQKTERGWSWRTIESHIKNVPNLTGFSHGVAGIAWALLELYKKTSEEQYRNAAEYAFAYEQSWFDPEQQNWADLRNWETARETADRVNFTTAAWCHGAPGITLSRLRAYEITQKEIYKDAAELGLRATVRTMDQNINGSFCLCHGLAGNSETLMTAARVLDNPEYQAFAEKVGHFGVERYSIADIPWPTGVPSGADTPSLMLGTAGIGYFYLRLYDPKAVPPILMMVPEYYENL